MLFVFSFMFFSLFFFFITIADSEIQCFECNSFDDPRWHDPFNYNYIQTKTLLRTMVVCQNGAIYWYRYWKNLWKWKFPDFFSTCSNKLHNCYITTIARSSVGHSFFVCMILIERIMASWIVKWIVIRNIVSHLLFMFSFIFFITIADSEIQCFECNSFDDPRCHDPFNYNYTNKEAMPDTAPCNGCCVKMVQFIGTGTEKICESRANSLIFCVCTMIKYSQTFWKLRWTFFSSCTIKTFLT